MRANLSVVAYNLVRHNDPKLPDTSRYEFGAIGYTTPFRQGELLSECEFGPESAHEK